MEIKPILNTAVGIGSLALVANSAKLLKDNLKLKPVSNKAIQNQGKNLVKGAVNLTLGTALLSSTSKIVGDIL